MRFNQFFVVGAAFMAAGIHAQDTTKTTADTTTATETSTATDGPQTIEVKVGLAGFKFASDDITANPGDTVRFRFYPPDHSVIRAAFGYPCIPWEYVYADGNPFYSGIEYVNTVAETTTFDVLVNDTEPIFYYCGAPNSCMDEGMIGVINANDTQTLKMQKDARDEFPIALIPGEPWPKEGNPMATVSGLHVTETGGSQPTSTSASDSSNSSDNGSTGHHFTAGEIAGIAIGSVALLLIIGAVVYFCGRRGGMEKGYRKSGYVGATSANAAANGTGTSPKPPMAEMAYPSASPDMSKHVPSGVSQYGLGVNNNGTPPMSPGVSTIGPNTQYGQLSPGLVREHASPHYQYQGVTPPPQGMHMSHPPPVEAPAAEPVELPASVDPGNSPLPQYSGVNQAGNTYSWAPQEEAGYRPGPTQKA